MTMTDAPVLREWFSLHVSYLPSMYRYYNALPPAFCYLSSSPYNLYKYKQPCLLSRWGGGGGGGTSFTLASINSSVYSSDPLPNGQ